MKVAAVSCGHRQAAVLGGDRADHLTTKGPRCGGVGPLLHSCGLIVRVGRLELGSVAFFFRETDVLLAMADSGRSGHSASMYSVCMCAVQLAAAEPLGSIS